MLLTNRVAIITGGAGGIGRGIAAKFAGEGCALAVADINLQAAEDTVKQVSGPGREGLALQCDATDGRQVKNAVDKVIARYGKIDILVNNAGGMSEAPPIEEMPEELWDKVVDLNLKSVFLFSKAVVPYMKQQQYGKIINLSSIGAVNPPRHSIHYNSAKAGVLGFTYDLAVALAPYKINVNVILPGFIQTDFYNGVAGLKTDQQRDIFFDSLGKMSPLQRIGTPQDIAGAALYLASELADFVTGTSLLVTGGIPLTAQPVKK